MCMCAPLHIYTVRFLIHPIKKENSKVMINVFRANPNAYVHLGEPNVCVCEHALNCDKGG